MQKETIYSEDLYCIKFYRQADQDHWYEILHANSMTNFHFFLKVVIRIHAGGFWLCGLSEANSFHSIILSSICHVLIM